MTKFGIAAAVVLILAVIGLRDAAFVVDAAEEAFVLRGDRVVSRHLAGLAWKIPIIERLAFIQAHTLRRVEADIEETLADGTSCQVSAEITYSIGDTRRALEWRLANKRSVSKETSSPKERTDYEEPSRIFSIALREKTSETSVDEAAGGALEQWIAGFSRRVGNGAVNSDGTKTVMITPQNVSCSDWISMSDCETVYREEQKTFSVDRYQLETDVSISFNLNLDSLDIYLQDQTRMRIGGVNFGFQIIDDGRFYETVRDEKNAKSRISALVDDTLRKSLGRLDKKAINSFDFQDLVPELQKGVTRLGVDIVFVDLANAYYQVGETVCR